MNRLLTALTLVCLIITLEYNYSYANDTYIYSLENLLNKTKFDSSKLQMLSYLSDNAPDGKWEKYNEQLGELSKKLINNTAARMEQHSEAGRINVSENTYQLTKNNFVFSIT